MLLETLVDVWVACAGPGSPVLSVVLRTAGAPTTGPTPKGAPVN